MTDDEQTRLQAYTSPDRVAYCPSCDDGTYHEWTPDEGLGDAYNQGWLQCASYGAIPINRDETITYDEFRQHAGDRR